jgi:hypothetical protein
MTHPDDNQSKKMRLKRMRDRGRKSPVIKKFIKLWQTILAA